MGRDIRLGIEPSHLVTVAESIGSWEKLFEAIGYLSQWNMSYPKVTIIIDGKVGTTNDLVAFYDDEHNDRHYTIGAVWHETHYGFHS